MSGNQAAKVKAEIPHCSVEHDYSCESPRLQFADGGRYIKLSFKLSPAAEWNSEMFYRRPEGRGKCKGFSFGSRRRMLGRLNSVSVGAAMPYFVTATLPDAVFCDDVGEFAARAKVWMDNFTKRLRRVVPEAAGFWRVEWQSRKSGPYEGRLFPHFHLLVWGLPERSLGERWTLEDGVEVHAEVKEAYVPVRDLQSSLDLLDALSSPAKGSTEPASLVEVDIEPLTGVEAGRDQMIEGRPWRKGEGRDIILPNELMPGYTFEGSWRYRSRCGALYDRVMRAKLEPEREEGAWMSFQDWASNAWYHVVDSHYVAHAKAGLRVERVRTWGGVLSYCAKYMAKDDCQFLSEVAFGRSWGIFNRKFVPWAKMVELDLDVEVGVRLRRVARRYLERRLGKRRRFAYGVTLFCDVAQFRKLWELPPPDPF